MGITLFYISNQINVFVARLQVRRVFTRIVKIPRISLVELVLHH